MSTETSYGVSFSLDPWESIGYQVTKIHLTEKLGGEVARGNIDMIVSNAADSDLEAITSENYGLLTIKESGDNGRIFEIPVFITSRSYYENTLSLGIACVESKKFFVEVLDRSFSDATTAFSEGLFPGNTIIESESDLPNGIRIDQFGETAYKVCNRLGLAFKRDSVFGYSWEGLVIKDLVLGDDTSGKIISVTGADMQMVSPYGLEYNKILLQDPYNPWETALSYDDSSVPQYESSPIDIGTPPENLSILKDLDKYYIISSEYRQLLENYLHNKNRLESGSNYSIVIKGTKMPSYSLGDTVEYTAVTTGESDLRLPFTKYYVYSNELFLSTEGSNVVDSNGLNFSWTTILRGLDESGEWTK